MNKIIKNWFIASIIASLMFSNSFAMSNNTRSFDFESGAKIKLGTLYVGDVKQLNPTNPTTGGNIPSYKSLGVGKNIEIKDTDSDENYQIQWVPVNVDGKKLLISDRNLLSYISWENLNTLGLIEGKTINIDGNEYILRVLSGGSGYKENADGYQGGNIENEWDKVIVNENKYSFLPTPAETDLDKTTDDTDLNGAHNQYWNWYKFNSWTQSLHTTESQNAIYRGYYSARVVSHNDKTTAYSNYGWRPVLEIPASAEELAEEAVQKAEMTKEDVDIENAIALVNNLPKNATRISLNSRIGIVYIEKSELSRDINDIEKARSFLNTLDEDSSKEMLNERLNNVLPDLELTLLNSSSNLDLYIKSENVLVMSVDTSSVTFDDFSGVEDVEKVNAININISSSLPYSLNAYLASEIVNGDKSNTMDKGIFNVKENSELTYNTFNTVDSKVILKDNNPSGNSINHGIDLMLKGNIAHEKDVYKTTLKFEAVQK